MVITELLVAPFSQYRDIFGDQRTERLSQFLLEQHRIKTHT